jgi:hypothetical protein
MISRKQGLHYQLAQFHEIEPEYCARPLLPPDAPIDEILVQLAEIRRRFDARVEQRMQEGKFSDLSVQ